MCFRDMEALNQALHAKRVCRILQLPSLLCAWVLKVRYFPEGSILSATCLACGSYTFRSILHGRELLQGLRWWIGDGTNVKIHQSNWIPWRGCLRPLGQPYIHGITRACDLLATGGDSCCTSKLEAIFSTDVVSDIKQILIGGSGTKDLSCMELYKEWSFLS